MEIIQIVIIVFGVFALSRAFLRFKDNNMGINSLLFWSVVWLAVIAVALNPFIFSSVAYRLGIATGMSFLVYASVIVLFYLVFRLYVSIENQNKTITKLVRQLAIRDAEKREPALGSKPKKR
jgi:hypothetical protein